MLHWAAHNDYQRMASLLISHGASLDVEDEVFLFSIMNICLDV